jgi:hypothetical protein
VGKKSKSNDLLFPDHTELEIVTLTSSARRISR